MVKVVKVLVGNGDLLVVGGVGGCGWRRVVVTEWQTLTADW